MKEFSRKVDDFISEVKRRIPIDARSFGEFTHKMRENRVMFVTAEVFTRYGTANHAPFIFRDFVISDNADATVYVGTTQSGRTIIFREYYDSESKDTQGKAIVRSLVTADVRLRELEEQIPGLSVAIKGVKMEMPRHILRNLRVTSTVVEPYPKKLDPRFDIPVPLLSR